MNKNKTIVIDEKTPLLVLAGPMFLELLLNTMLNNVDMLMLSHYDEYAVGAVGNANIILFMMNIFFSIIAMATNVVAAQYLGAKLHEKMNMIYTLAVMVNLAFGLILSATFCIANPLIMDFLNVSPQMRQYSMIYIYIVGGGGFLTAVFNVMIQILRCNGYTKIGMWVTFSINLINIAGNYLFLYGPLTFLKMGVAGVAISTVVARILAVIALFGFFYITKTGRISLRYLDPFPGKLLVRMIKIGLPSAGENLTYNLYQTTLLSFVNMMGNDAVNARVYCNTLISFVMIFSNACAMSTQIITGHLVGAGKTDEAYKRVFKTLRVSMPITIVLAIINVILCRYTLGIFTQNQNIIALGQLIMIADIFVEIGRCLNLTFVSSLKAAGAYIFPFIAGLICNWGLGLTTGYLVGVMLGLGVVGIYIGTATDECIRGLIVMSYWYRKKWLGKSVVDQKDKNVRYI
ncbi:MATE family efflux transporter [Butyrivibrio sp. INlla16]|uniref:MATE family efflux transporter n=1 Tax=Butyrivibrio sp. INlla16 TaxID=1520807 RepID=UPI000881AE42|nr:MATE family efflux transporter [Butyrivibrio sp. INlla16]SDB64154.1 putative efflux protein, MATE family [Butyrivibrio sp. INlla16]